MLNMFDLQNRELFEGIQGNILKSHGRHHTANVFIRCIDGRQTETKAWIRSLVAGENAIVESGYVQLRNNVLWKESKVDTGLFASIHISANGYKYLFDEAGKQLFNDEPFKKGMKAGLLNDPDPEQWEPGLRTDNHFMLLMAHADPRKLELSLNAIFGEILAFGNITAVERGKALFNREGAGLEHFGYVDGISQPLFFDDEWEQYRKDNNIQNPGDIKFDPRAEKELVLTQDPFFPQDPNALGSYFVFRKLEQNVKAFKQAEKDLAATLELNDEEILGAMLVGRFEDGTPIEVREEDGMIHSAVYNNFDYNLADASKCPFHGHIRKTNPRSSMPTGSGGMAESKSRIMARRGIPFGTRDDDPNDGQIFNKPEKDVGLLFMSYQASIENQFEFIQQSWANNPFFPNFDTANPDGLDPIVGQGDPRAMGKIATEWGNPATMTTADFAQFVHMKGGEYFFAPSISFLENIETI